MTVSSGSSTSAQLENKKKDRVGLDWIRKKCFFFFNWKDYGIRILIGSGSVPTDCRSFRTGPKKVLEDRSIQDLKIAKRTSKVLFFDPGIIIRFFKMVSL